MKNRLYANIALARNLLAAVAMLAILPSLAQVPVDDNGETLGQYEKVYSSAPAAGNEDIPLLSVVDLEDLVGPIALYPDDLLAIVLPAAAYPLQIVDAARFLEALEIDPSLEPDPEWDDSIVALLNYPEVIELLNDDIDWTWRLGEAVVSQQGDVVAAIETFRDRAYAAGNLKSDSYQSVSHDDGVIEITPAAEDVIYVPYYEPARVVVYQPRPVYYYYPRPYPVYYYPYASSYAFDRGHFWGVTTAFTIGWYSDSLNVFHHSYYGHPYYGRSYFDRWWYRRPTINTHNTTYVGNTTNVTINHYDGGDHWRPRHDRRNYVDGRRITRNREYPRRRIDKAGNNVQSGGNAQRKTTRYNTQRDSNAGRDRQRAPIAFRQRAKTTAVNRSVRTGVGQTATRPLRRDADAASQNRSVKKRAQNELRQGLRAETRERRITPASKLRPATTTTPVQRSQQPRQAGRTESSAAVRRTDGKAQNRRVERVTQVRRTEPARRVESAADLRRSEPTPRSQAAAPPRRPDTARQPSGRSEPQQQRTERNSNSSSNAKQSSASKSTRRSKRRQ